MSVLKSLALGVCLGVMATAIGLHGIAFFAFLVAGAVAFSLT